MNLEYGNTRTYQHELDKERLHWLTARTNRSTSQTQFLFNLVDGDFERLKLLEMKLKNCFVFYCPDTKQELEAVMNMEDKTNLLTL